MCASFAEYSLFYTAFLQKRPMLSTHICVQEQTRDSTPRVCSCTHICVDPKGELFNVNRQLCIEGGSDREARS